MNTIRIFPLLFGLLLGVFMSCSNSERISSNDEEPADHIDIPTIDSSTTISFKGFLVEVDLDSLPGMLHVTANKAPVTLGTNDAQARTIERPQMTTVLDYEFKISRTEVTCGEFKKIMPKAIAMACDSDKLPATNVNYYDAILFANALSKKMGYDTAYTYTSAIFNAENHCTNLEGFAFRPAVDAFRLPTEAEWMLVAGLYWDPLKSWNADNSDYKIHEVCSIQDSSLPESIPCDMAGNVMEWVNDWQGAFRDTTVNNYAGAPDGGSLGQRVLKGGSCRNPSQSIKLYSRGDVYMVTSSTHAEYVGFRLAFGHIPDAVWMGGDGQANSSRLLPMASATTLSLLTETHKMKLAFRNDLSGNLAFMDYSSGTLSVKEIADTIEVYHPEISPDGMKVAFCTKLEGVSGKSALYVRDLNAEGSNLVKLDVESAAIPRWRILDNGDTVIVYVNDAGNNRDDAAFQASSTWQVPFMAGHFGTPSKILDGAYHGGISENNRLAVTGARLLRARVADFGSTLDGSSHDTIWYNGEQACNASLSKDGSERTLFLDFGGQTGQQFAGTQYRTHERLLVADKKGKLIQSFAAPAGYTFDHTEWVADKNLAVATIANENGAHQKIVLVNMIDGSTMELMEGEELWHPTLWVSKRPAVQEFTALDADSAGVYYSGIGGETALLMRYNMELLWLFRDVTNVLILGSSRPLSGVIPDDFSENFYAINLANVPNMVVSSRYIAENYAIPHLKNLKYIIISLDIDLWYNYETSYYNFFFMEYKNQPGFVYDENHNFWKDGYPEGLAEKTVESLGNEYFEICQVITRGYLFSDPVSWGGTPTVDYDSTWMSFESANFEASFNHLEKLIETSEEHGIYVIGVVFPQSPKYKDTGSFGKYGILRSEAPALLQRIQQLETQYPNFVFVDENKMGDHDYTDEMAYNEDHLASLGAKQLTARLDSILIGLQKASLNP